VSGCGASTIAKPGVNIWPFEMVKLVADDIRAANSSADPTYAVTDLEDTMLPAEGTTPIKVESEDDESNVCENK
jgi:hypothetical protein